VFRDSGRKKNPAAAFLGGQIPSGQKFARHFRAEATGPAPSGRRDSKLSEEAGIPNPGAVVMEPLRGDAE